MAITNPTTGGLASEVVSGTQAVTSLTNASALGAGTALDGQVCRQSHTLAVTTSAGVSAGVVQLQGSLDGVNWFNFPGSTSITTSTASTTSAVAASNTPARAVRANITTAITGGTVTAVVASA